MFSIISLLTLGHLSKYRIRLKEMLFLSIFFFISLSYTLFAINIERKIVVY